MYCLKKAYIIEIFLFKKNNFCIFTPNKRVSPKTLLLKVGT